MDNSLIGPAAEDAVPILIETVQRGRESVRLRAGAATALGLIGPPAKSAVLPLVDSLQSDDPQFRGAVIMALERIGPRPRALVPKLLEALRGDDVEAQGSAISLIRSFAEERARSWMPLLAHAYAPVVRSWLSRHQDLYGIVDLEVPDRAGQIASADVFGLLGGRPVVRETLQMQLLDNPGLSLPEEMTLPISEVRGVEVKSHPFEEMLQADPGESVLPAIAQLAPDDHGLLYFSSLSALRSYLDAGVSFLFRLNSAFDGNSLDFDLRSRYLRAIGVDEQWLLELMANGSVEDVGIVFPDFYFADGTDIGVILSVSDWHGIQPLLEQAGTVSVVEKPVAIDTGIPGQQAHWGTRDHYLLISTSRALLDRLLDPIATKGKGRLAQSAEFQYMLGRLPINDQTQAYLYLSDTFIRHLVGPQSKIGQLRRMQARAQMEFLTAAALLYRLDGHPQTPTVAQLQELGYIAKSIPERKYRLTEGLTATSEQFGSPAHLWPLSADPVDQVTEEEAASYREYVLNYSQFWRQYFDPIAFRLDQIDAQSYELTTFILPLLDSELYDEAREVVSHSSGKSGFRTPVLNPSPALTRIFNLVFDIPTFQRP